jgi:hypothetical protein
METLELSPSVACSPWNHHHEGPLHMNEARRAHHMHMHELSPLQLYKLVKC